MIVPDNYDARRPPPDVPGQPAPAPPKPEEPVPQPPQPEMPPIGPPGTDLPGPEPDPEPYPEPPEMPRPNLEDLTQRIRQSPGVQNGFSYTKKSNSTKYQEGSESCEEKADYRRLAKINSECPGEARRRADDQHGNACAFRWLTMWTPPSV